VSPGEKRKALVTGARGQVGTELLRNVPVTWQAVGLGSAGLDITQPSMVHAVLQRERPTLVINAAAYTAVDAAERAAEAAEAVNVAGPRNLATAAERVGARVIQLSTDFVFDGEKDRPYLADDQPRPLSVYGRTKEAGEREVLRLGAQGLVLRTAWVYASHGRNFVLRMLGLMRERETLSVVADQIGTPTWARSLTAAVWAAADRPEVHGILHWTDAGSASWHDFGVAIGEEAHAIGLLPRVPTICPVHTGEFPAAARRPAFSVLDTRAAQAALGLAPAPWRENLRRMLGEMAGA
jgi:dTDP-4-dehydrorhamnose reductase